MDVISEFGGLAQLSASVILAVVVLWVFRGQLVPARYYNEMKAHRDRLQEALDEKEAVIVELVAQQTELVAANMTAKRVLESLSPGEEEK